jgi:hypothetical protein
MTTPNEVLDKYCSSCNETKPRADFYFRSNGWISCYCKVCTRAKSKARKFGPDRERVLILDRVALKARRRRIRDEVFTAYGGYVCNCCGETGNSFLTLDHINNDGGKFRKEVLGTRTAAGYHTYNWLLRNNFPPVVQVLCMNCQHSKLMNGGTCEHKLKNV